MKDSKQELLSFLADNTFQKIGLLGHTSADPDALAACFGMKFLLEKMHPSSEIDVLIDNYNKPSQKLIEYIDEPYLENTKKNYDLIIIVDVNSPEQLGKFTEVVMDTPANKRIIIDHHSPSDFAQKEVQIAYIEDKRTSTAEMITELLFDLDLSPPSKILTILLSGILYDSRRFYSLNLELVTILKKMLEGGAKYSLARDLIQREIGLSERFARLKSAKRSEYERIHGWIIVWTLVGAFEGSSARALIDVGADVVLVYSRRKNLS
ncbi:MAG: DHH family phosphoesterase, partial [Asgard group archaeon]|nr:DHH family phosphoesterase [Asgard group archaeon]